MKLNDDQRDKLNEILATDGVSVLFAIMAAIQDTWDKKILCLQIKPERIQELALDKARQEGVQIGFRDFRTFLEEAAKR